MWDALTTVAGLALPQVLDGALQAVGGGPVSLVTGPVTTLLRRTFVDNAAGIERALSQAEHRAWRAIELALAGRTEGWTVRITDGADTTGFAAAVKGYLDSLPAVRLPAGLGRPEFAARCLAQLHAARAAGIIGNTLTRADRGPGSAAAIITPSEMAALAEQTAGELRFRSPQDRLARQWEVLDGLAERLRTAGHADLALLVSARPPANESLLAAAVKYFFRQAVEEDERLHRRLTWATWEAVTDDLRVGLERVTELQVCHAEKLEQSLTGLAVMLTAIERNNLTRHGEVITKLQKIEKLVEALSSERIGILTEVVEEPAEVVSENPRAFPAVGRASLPSRVSAEPRTDTATAPPRAVNPIFLRPATPQAEPPANVERINLSKSPTAPQNGSSVPAAPSAPAVPSTPAVPPAFRVAPNSIRFGQPLSDLLKPRSKGPSDTP